MTGHPSSHSALTELTASEAARLIRRGEVSPVELVEALLARIDAVEPDLAAWEIVDRERALAEARAVAAPGADRAGLLAGVPVGVKDIVDAAGLPTTGGFASRRDTTAREDSAVVSRLRRAGAIVLGKTVTTQAAYVDPPRTRNPWNAGHTPGGSSSGSAAAVAARVVPLAIGSQTGGSVLRPAAYCGVVGLKPTYGRISRRGVLPLAWSIDHVGVLCRSVEDAALFLQAASGHDPADPGSSLAPVGAYLAAVSQPLKRPRLGLLVDFLDRAQPTVRPHYEDVAARFGRAGATVREVRLPVEVQLILAVHRIIMQAEAAAVHEASPRSAESGPQIRAYVEVGRAIPATAYLQAQRLRRRIRGVLTPLFGEFDCLLLPTVSGPAPGTETTGDPSFQAPWSLLGLPALTLPSGLAGDGLPLGTQLVGPAFGEETLLRVGNFAEEVIGPFPPPPDRSTSC
ncbi:MAG: amidase [Chloroflexi bacterium]|nr:amidase [Chloroflexota bacterium]